MIQKNHDYWLNYASKIGSCSKDRSTKVGAVIVDAIENELISTGYNGPVRGFVPNYEQEFTRPEKYLWNEHAERNAIYNHLQDIVKDKFIICIHFPSMEEVRAILSCGIKLIAVPYQFLENNEVIPNYSRVVELCYKTGTSIAFFDKDGTNKVEFIYPTLMYDYFQNSKNQRKIREFMDILSETTLSGSSSLIVSQQSFAIKAQGDEKIISGKTVPAVKDGLFKIAKKEFNGHSIYTNFCPCDICSLAIVCVGLKSVCTKKINVKNDADARWQESFNDSKIILKENDVSLLEI